MKVIYQNLLMDLNYKDFPCHRSVIYNYCQNCLTVWSHGPFQGIIPNNIHRTIEIVNNQCMLIDDARVCVTVKVYSLFFVIYQYYIISNGAGSIYVALKCVELL